MKTITPLLLSSRPGEDSPLFIILCPDSKQSLKTEYLSVYTYTNIPFSCKRVGSVLLDIVWLMIYQILF